MTRFDGMASKLLLLAVPFSFALVSFIGYASQWLFNRLEPGSLTSTESFILNFGTLAVLGCYTRAVLVDPGKVVADGHEADAQQNHGEGSFNTKRRWCKKCENYKPPRSHHCRVCKRYAPPKTLPEPLATGHVSRQALTSAIDAYLKWIIIVRGP